MNWKYYGRKVEKKPSWIFSSYLLALILLSFHLSVTSGKNKNSSRFELLDTFVENYYKARRDIIVRTDTIERRSDLLVKLKKLKGNKTSSVDKLFSEKSGEYNSLKIFDRGIKQQYVVEKLTDFELSDFCEQSEDFLINKYRFDFLNFGDPVTITELSKDRDSLEFACPGFDFKKIESFILSFNSFDFIEWPEFFYVSIYPPEYIFRKAPRKTDFFKTVTFHNNFNTSFFYFPEEIESPWLVCMFHVLNSSDMAINSYQVSSTQGLFSSFATERRKDKEVKFYLSNFLKERYFCILAKQEKDIVWTNISIGKVL